MRKMKLRGIVTILFSKQLRFSFHYSTNHHFGMWEKKKSPPNQITTMISHCVYFLNIKKEKPRKKFIVYEI
jgi:hypothetical protein